MRVNGQINRGGIHLPALASESFPIFCGGNVAEQKETMEYIDCANRQSRLYSMDGALEEAPPPTKWRRRLSREGEGINEKVINQEKKGNN